jgi:cobalt-zinc-cadmium efflux system outer membrane protein
MTPLFLLAAGLTLADLESRLLQQNPQLQQANAAVSKAQQAGLYPNPTIGATGEHVAKSTRGGSVGGFVEQRIVMGGKRGIDRALANQEVEQSRAMRDAWSLRLKGQLKIHFYATVAATERVALSRKLAANAAESLKIARELENIGRLDVPDIRAAEVESHRASIKVDQALQNERRAWQELAALLNADSLTGQPLDAMIDDFPQLDRAALWARVREQSPEVTMAITEKAQADIALRQARAARIPDLQLRGGLRNNREDGDVPRGRPVGVEGIFDIGVEIPLFNRQQGNIQAARAGVERARLAPVHTERALQARFANAWQRYETALTVVVRYRDEVLPAARSAFELYQKNFRTMQSEYPRVLTSQRTYFDLQDEYLDALRDGWQAVAELESLLLARTAD